MKKDFSTSWKSSTQPRKQRKYLFNMPLHLKSKLLNVHLSKDLREKYNTRSIRVRKGDVVKVLRGQFKGQSGKIETVDIKKTRVTVTKIEVSKKDGTKALYPLNPSNLVIEELDLSDKKRLEKFNSEAKATPTPKVAQEAKAKPTTPKVEAKKSQEAKK